MNDLDSVMDGVTVLKEVIFLRNISSLRNRIIVRLHVTSVCKKAIAVSLFFLGRSYTLAYFEKENLD